MGGLRGISLLAVIVAGACQSPRVALDLRENPSLYRSPGYRSRVAVDRSAFIAPLVDRRGAVDAPVAEASGPYPVQWMPEGRWDRPLPAMIEDILRDELQDSGVFARLQRDPPPSRDALVITPVLLAARAGAQEHPTGRRSLAEVGLELVVYGPGGAGRTPIWRRAVHVPVQSEVMVRPPSAPSMLGMALRQCMQQALAALDQSNVARSGVPIDSGDDSGR